MLAQMTPIDPHALRLHYRRFLNPGRLLLTGHSHQAWPDVARDAVIEAYDDAAKWADDKWSAAFEAADVVRTFIGELLACPKTQIALAQNTHELVLKFLSALPLRERPQLISTTGEFHSLTRQLKRLQEEKGLEIEWIEAEPAATLAERLAEEVSHKTAAVLTSTVLFGSAARVPHLDQLVKRARGLGAEVLLDAYHGFGVFPFTLADLGAEDAFVVGGGYKYLQWGEGNCFMRVPGRPFRPVLTGWFAGFAQLSQRQDGVAYGTDGAEAFAGSTYDPVSHYRARAVIRFFQAQQLTPARLWASYQRQTELLFEQLSTRAFLTPRSPEARGGFVAIPTAHAADAVTKLHAEGILCDSRGNALRLGPAPYLTDDELIRGARAVDAIL